MIFLQSHGVSTRLAVKIYKQYGNEAIPSSAMTPTGLPKTSTGSGSRPPTRSRSRWAWPRCPGAHPGRAAVTRSSTLSDDGHCFATRTAPPTARLLEITPKTACRAQLEALVARTKFAEELIRTDGGAIYLPPFYHAERGVPTSCASSSSKRDRLEVFKMSTGTALSRGSTSKRHPTHRTARRGEHGADRKGEHPDRRTWHRQKHDHRLSLIHLLQAKGGRCCCARRPAAPPSASARPPGWKPKPSTACWSSNPAQGMFARDRENPLDADLVIVDEASMVDILLMNHLLEAIEAGQPSAAGGRCRPVAVGRRRQCAARPDRQRRDPGHAAGDHLPPGGGQLHHRQCAPHQPGRDAACSTAASRFLPFSEDDAGNGRGLVLDLVAQRIPTKFGFRSVERYPGAQPHAPRPGGRERAEQAAAGAAQPARARRPSTHG